MDLGLIEVLFFFGAVLALAFWELWSVRRPAKRKRPSASEKADDRDSDS